VVVKKGQEKIVEDIFKKWDLNCAVIGEVTKGNELEFFWEKELVAKVPASTLVLGGGAPVYEREYKEPAYYKQYKKFNIDKIEEPENMKDVAWSLLKNPNIASKKWVFEQYDTMVRTLNMSTNCPTDAGIVNLKGTNKALALTVDCNARYVKADPEIGTMIAVAEAARNIVCSGGEPSAITNCLNFGNPYNPEAFWQFVGAIKGMSAACLKFETPVTGGNVSFYNQTVIGKKTEPVMPTPTIGMLGILEDKKLQTSLAFKKKGDMIFLVGRSANDISSSEYLVSWHKVKESPVPQFDLDFEYKIQKAIKDVIRKGLLESAHDVSDGGLFITLVESSIHNNLGFDITSDAEIRLDAFLFGEAQSRIVVSVDPEKEGPFIDYMLDNNIPFSTLGHVTKGQLRVDDLSYGFIEDAKKVYDNALSEYLNQ